MATKGNGLRLLLMRHLSSLLPSRASLADKLGQSYGGDRDLYEALGYKTTLVFENFWNLYVRGGIAKRIIDAPAKATWRGHPELIDPSSDNGDSSKELNEKWDMVVKGLRLWHYMERVDKLAGIGRYGGLFIGFNDGRPLDQPVGPCDKILYVSAYHEGGLGIGTLDNDLRSPRYGCPLMYNIAFPTVATGSVGAAGSVHWSRVIHVADGLLTDEVYGTPRLQAVYNHVEDLLKVVGSSGEMFYRGAFPGYAFKLDADAELDNTSIDDLESEIEQYMHQMKRYLRVQGIDVKAIEQQVASPMDYTQTVLKLISGTTEIPLRILSGSEEGKLASSQDESNWNSRIDERRRGFAEPVILRQFIDRLMTYKILPNVPDYAIVWPDIEAMDENTKATIAAKKSEALFRYTTSPNAALVITPHRFRRDFLGYSEEESDRMQNEIDSMYGADSSKFPVGTAPTVAPDDSDSTVASADNGADSDESDAETA